MAFKSFFQGVFGVQFCFAVKGFELDLAEVALAVVFAAVYIVPGSEQVVVGDEKAGSLDVAGQLVVAIEPVEGDVADYAGQQFVDGQVFEPTFAQLLLYTYFTIGGLFLVLFYLYYDFLFFFLWRVDLLITGVEAFFRDQQFQRVGLY